MTSAFAPTVTSRISRASEASNAPLTSHYTVDHLAPRELRQALADVPTPLATAAALVDGTPIGMVLGSFVVHSLEPALVSVSLQTTSRSWPVLRTAESIGLSVLTENNRDVIDGFYRPSQQRFDGLDYATNGSAILFPDASLHLTTELVEEITVGDHIVAILRVTSVQRHAAEGVERPRPLVFHRSTVTTTL